MRMDCRVRSNHFSTQCGGHTFSDVIQIRYILDTHENIHIGNVYIPIHVLYG